MHFLHRINSIQIDQEFDRLKFNCSIIDKEQKFILSFFELLINLIIIDININVFYRLEFLN